jgi:hypothetical protein
VCAFYRSMLFIPRRFCCTVLLAVTVMTAGAEAARYSGIAASSMRSTAESCYISNIAPTLLNAGGNLRHARSLELCKAIRPSNGSHKQFGRRTMAATSLCMSAVTGAGDIELNLPALRRPENRKWFVEPPKEHNNPGSSYFQETWGPVLEEARKKKALAAGDEFQNARSLGTAADGKNLDNTDADVQAMLDDYSDSDESEFDESARDSLLNLRDQPARAQGAYPIATPAKPPSPTQKIVSYKPLPSASRASSMTAAPPRCGPRSSSPRGRVV